MKQIMKKLKKYDDISPQLENKFGQMNKRFDSIDKKLADHDKKLADHDGQLEIIAAQVDRTALMVVSHSERFDKIEREMATKKDLREIALTLDVLVKLALKKDQELTFMSHVVQRQGKDIERIKSVIGHER